MSDGADETGIGELPLDDAAFEPGGDGRESGDDPGGRRDLVSGGRGSVGDSCPTSESMTIDLGSGISMHLVEIRPGRFMMGSPASEVGRCDNETQHEVAISKAFWLGQTPVTQVQWEAVMGTQPSYYCGNPNHPVEKVSWQDATAFCRCLSEATGMAFRLPTEAEWEYACRAGTAATYSFGDDPSSLGENAWFEDNSGGSTNPVAMKKSNRWGLYDMHGNVWEWCSDWYEDYSLNAATDPEGPKSGLYRVVRGGSWINSSMACRAARRINDVPGGCTHALGFRVARSP